MEELKAAGLLSLSLMYGFLIGVPDDDIEQSIRSTIGEMERALIAAGAQEDVDRIREGHRKCVEMLSAP